jgi:hypothetical protein
LLLQKYILNIITFSVNSRKGPPGSPSHGWVDNIKMDLREIVWDDMDWIDLAYDKNRWGGLF